MMTKDTVMVGKESLSDQEREANAGFSVTLKKLGSVTVRELSLENTIALLQELAVVLGSIESVIGDSESSSTRGWEWMSKLLSDPNTQKALRAVAAASTDRREEEFVGMGLSDWLKLIKGFKVVMDLEEIKDLFFEIVPPDMMKGWTTPSTVQGQ